jgi:hypothetical protein
MSFNPLFKSKAVEAVRLQSRYLGHDLSNLYEYNVEGEPCHLLAHCANCGMRADVDSGTRTLTGDALHRPCDHSALRSIESMAWMISKIPALMLRRFQQEMPQFSEEMRALFTDGDFQPENYCLMSRDGIWSLRYEMREYPHEPISDDNRQSAGGIVTLERDVAVESIRWARYTGPRLNPNGHENSKHWVVLPLETNECGWFYCDSNGRWRFRRDDGVIGYFVKQSDCSPEGRPTGAMGRLSPLAPFPSRENALFESADLPPQPMVYP